MIDGHQHSPSCDRQSRSFCPNQCAGNGNCTRGFCKCLPGFYGGDCALPVSSEQAKSLGMDAAPVPAEPMPAPQRMVSVNPLTRFPPGQALKRRPLIYVYDMPPIYDQIMIAYADGQGLCPRVFDAAGRGSKVERLATREGGSIALAMLG